MEERIVNDRIPSLIAFLVMEFVRDLILDEFDNSSFLAEPPGDNLLRVLKTFRFDNCPSCMDSSITPPFEVMQIPSRMDLFHCLVAVFDGVG